MRVAFISLGCAKNLVDSEKMLGKLAEGGCVITADESDAEAIVINTCGFLDASRIEADEVIREAIARKKAGTLRRVIVAGCLAQRDQAALLDRIEGIDALVGVNNRDDIVEAVLGKNRRREKAARRMYLSNDPPDSQLDTPRLRITPHHYAYLRIAEGCDQKCTFCTIPAIRGPLRCKTPEAVLDEACELVNDGAVEINLIGQDTTSYRSIDGAREGDLADLLRQLDRVDGVRWIRLLYAYPTEMTKRILDAIAECPRVCNYVDLPLQHINDRILKAMHRRIDRVQTEGLLETIRKRIPGVAIRTSLIAGFPGETEAEFSELVRFVQDFRFDALGVFPFSSEPDTPAGRMAGGLPKSIIDERLDILMRAQQDVAFSIADARVGQAFDVLIDECDESGVALGRHFGQAVDVDSVTRVSSCSAKPGEFVAVRCVGRRDYDLEAVPAADHPS